jgi:hypothetical protein
MTTAATTAPDRAGVVERWAGLGSALYVALFVIGSLLEQDGPDTDSPPAKLIAYWSKGSHRDKAGIGWFLAIIGVFFFLWFLVALRQAVRRLDGDGFLAGLVTIGGAVYATLTLAAVTTDAVLKTAADDTYRHEVYPQLVAVSDDFWFVLHSAGGIGAAAMMVGASLAALRARKVPAWAGWLGVLAGISAIVSIFAVPWIVIAVWLLVVGALLVRQGAQSGPR